MGSKRTCGRAAARSAAGWPSIAPPITGRLLFNMLGAIGQFETEIRAERQMDGIKKAKDRSVQFGKRPALTDSQIAELREQRAQGILIKNLMARCSLSKATIYRYLGPKET